MSEEISHGADGAGSETLRRVEETLDVGVREAVTGRVRVRTVTDMVEQIVRQDLDSVSAEVVRVPVDRTLEPGEAPPAPRTSGNVTIIPILEEVLVVETRLHLKEEVHVTTNVTTEQIEAPVTLRRQQAVVERITGDATTDRNKE